MNPVQIMNIILRLLLTALFAISAASAGHAAVDRGRLYLVGDATPAGWNENLPEEMVPLGNGCFLWDGVLTDGELKFLNTRGDWGSSIVTSRPGLEFAEGVQYDLFYQKGSDDKFVNSRPGHVRIVVDLVNMKVNFRRPALCIVGEGALGWSLERTIPLFADDGGKLEWSGQLRKGEVKFLDGAGEGWAPCYNAPFEGDELSPGGHQTVYNQSEYDSAGRFVDFKYVVPKPGLYTLRFSRGADGRFYSLDVEREAEPSLSGGFRAPEGRYLVGVDREAGTVHLCALPARLFLTSGENHFEELRAEANAPGRFSAELRLTKGLRYALCSDRSRRSATLLSPNTDTDLSAGPTSNLAPFAGGAFTVSRDGLYTLTVNFSGAAPLLQLSAPVSVEHAPGSMAAPAPVLDGRRLGVLGEYRALSVVDVAGRTVARSVPCILSTGVYIVSIDNNTYKIFVR